MVSWRTKSDRCVSAAAFPAAAASAFSAASASSADSLRTAEVTSTPAALASCAQSRRCDGYTLRFDVAVTPRHA